MYSTQIYNHYSIENLIYYIDKLDYLNLIYRGQEYISIELYNCICKDKELLLALIDSEDTIKIFKYPYFKIKSSYYKFKIPIDYKKTYIENKISPPNKLVKFCDTNNSKIIQTINGKLYYNIYFNEQIEKLFISYKDNDNYYSNYFTNTDINMLTDFWKLNIVGFICVLNISNIEFVDDTLIVNYKYLTASENYSQFKFKLIRHEKNFKTY
jgi:hypothetical protein